MDYCFFNELTNECKYIREEVFMKEQTFVDEFDEIDKYALHLIVYIDNLPIATGRVFKSEDSYYIGRIAVLKQYRKNKIGSYVIKLLEDKAKELGAKTITLSAQCRVKSFYEKLGYIPIGSTYYEEYCEHIKMIKNI